MLRLRGCVLRLLPALANAMATACLIAFFLVVGWLVPIAPSFFQSSTSVLILLLTTGWLDPFLSGTIFLLTSEPRMFSTLSPQQVPLAQPAGERTIITLIVPFERGGYRAVSRIKDQFRAS